MKMSPSPVWLFQSKFRNVVRWFSLALCLKTVDGWIGGLMVGVDDLSDLQPL